MTDSIVMTIFLHWWIFLIGGVASGRVCPYSLLSRLLFFSYWKNCLNGIFFQSWEQTNVGPNNRVIKKKLCFSSVFFGKGVYPQNLWAKTKKNSLPFWKYFFLLFLISLNTFWNANSIWVRFNAEKKTKKKTFHLVIKCVKNIKKVKKET